MELDVRKSSNRRRWAAVPAIAAFSVVLAACGGSSKSASGGAGSSASAGAKGSVTAAPKSAAAVAPAPKFTKVLVTATDFKFALNKVTGYTPGNYTFSLTNKGKAKHAFEMNGPGLKNQAGATVAAGQTTDLVVPLVKGTYEVWSPVGTDKAQGMSTTIVVS
jgi:uncharacterized cupredoxin-like copper-binding protein